MADSLSSRLKCMFICNVAVLDVGGGEPENLAAFEVISLIVGAATANRGGTAAQNPIDFVGTASIIAGMLVFLFFAITISINSYKKRKETDARVAEWEKSEQERKKRFNEEMSVPETK